MPNIITNTPASIWTPDGEKQLDRDIIKMSYAYGSVWRDMHKVAQEYRIALLCSLCGQPFQGLNNGIESEQSVACRCREFRFPSKRQ